MKMATILVVEDDDAVRSVLVRGLKREGYAVLEASGKSRIDFDRIEPVDVLVSDVGLPAESGYDVAKRCRQRWPDCEIVLISGYAVEDLETQGLPQNVKVVPKPMPLADLAETVDNLLKRRAWRALRTDNNNN